MATQKGRRPDYEIELSDSDGYIGRICIADEHKETALAWVMLQGTLDYYISQRFAEADETEDD